MTSTNERVSVSSMASAEDSNIFTCTNLLNALGDQLQAQMDIISEYMLFQTKLDRQQNHATKLLKNIDENTNDVEKKWNDFVDGTLEVKEKMVNEIDKNSKFASGSTEGANKIENVSKMTEKIRPQHDDILESVAKVKELTESYASFHSKTKFDQRRLSEIEAKNEDVKKLDNNIKKILEREIKIAGKIHKAAAETEKIYGVWELTAGYQQLLRHLGTTLDTLETLKSQSDKDTTPISTLSTEELEILISMLKRLDDMITSEISNK